MKNNAKKMIFYLTKRNKKVKNSTHISQMEKNHYGDLKEQKQNRIMAKKI